MATDIRVLGNSGYEFVSATHRILIDPYLRGCPGAPCAPEELATPDVILVTHAAYNHLGDTAEIARRTGAPVVCAVDVAKILASRGVDPTQLLQTVWGVQVRVNGLVVKPIQSMHWSFGVAEDGTAYSGPPLGYVVEPEPGLRLYHSADTAMFDMSWIRRCHAPSVAFLCVSQPWEIDRPPVGELLTGELTPEEGAIAADMLGVDVAVATHYLTPDEHTERFVRAVAAEDRSGTRQAVAPSTGQTWRADQRDGRWLLQPIG